MVWFRNEELTSNNRDGEGWGLSTEEAAAKAAMGQERDGPDEEIDATRAGAMGTDTGCEGMDSSEDEMEDRRYLGCSEHGRDGEE